MPGNNLLPGWGVVHAWLAVPQLCITYAEGHPTHVGVPRWESVHPQGHPGEVQLHPRRSRGNPLILQDTRMQSCESFNEQMVCEWTAEVHEAAARLARAAEDMGEKLVLECAAVGT